MLFLTILFSFNILAPIALGIAIINPRVSTVDDWHSNVDYSRPAHYVIVCSGPSKIGACKGLALTDAQNNQVVTWVGWSNGVRTIGSWYPNEGTSTRLIRYAGGSEDTPGGVISDPATSPGLDDVSEPWASGTEAFIPSW